MKKAIALSLSIFLSVILFAQVADTAKLRNKKGFVITPEMGDWCIGVDASPFLDYFGNFVKLSTSANIAPNFGFTAQNPGFVSGKYMITDKKAYRFSLMLGMTANVENEPNAINNTKTDKISTSAISFGGMVGLEYYKTIKSRLVGYYGYEAGFMKMPYTGQIRNSSQTVTGRLSYKNSNSSTSDYVEKGGNRISVAGAGFAGVEYFFMPKFSFSGEFNLFLDAYYQTERVYEPAIGPNEIIDASKYGFNLMPKASGALKLRFYF